MAALAACNLPPEEEDGMDMLQEGLVAGAVIAVAIIGVAPILAAINRRTQRLPARI